MALQIFKVIFAGILIGFSSWLAGKKPDLAGFVLAMPLSTMIALVFTQAEFQDAGKSVAFAKSVFFAVPLSLVFFLPFLFADRLRASFWSLYSLGFVALVGAFFVHRHFIGD